MVFERLPNETDEELIYRVCGEKDKIGSWQKVADILNKLTNSEYTESKYRKQYHAFTKMFETNEKKMLDSSPTVKELQSAMKELEKERKALEKEKVKIRDERNEYNRIIREEARKESYIDLVKQALSEIEPRTLGSTDSIKAGVKDEFVDYDNDLIVHMTDIHAGLEIDNAFNKFNEDVLKQRFVKYLREIIWIANVHHPQNIHVILSEVISGLIHENLRIENNLNLIEQFLLVSEYIADFLHQLNESEIIPYDGMIHVYVCPGNHSRVMPKKEQGLKGENFDHLLLPYLSAKMQNYTNIEFHENTTEESIAEFRVRGNLVFAAHGDKDDPKSVVQKLSLLLHATPDLVYLGHRHKNGLTTVYDTKVIESGSWCGPDNYALDLRLRTKPEQMVSVVGDNGLECLYDIQLA